MIDRYTILGMALVSFAAILPPSIAVVGQANTGTEPVALDNTRNCPRGTFVTLNAGPTGFGNDWWVRASTLNLVCGTRYGVNTGCRMHVIFNVYYAPGDGSIVTLGPYRVDLASDCGDEKAGLWSLNLGFNQGDYTVTADVYDDTGTADQYVNTVAMDFVVN